MQICYLVASILMATLQSGRQDDSGTYESESICDVNAWKRLIQYGRRVKSLVLFSPMTSENDQHIKYHTSLFIRHMNENARKWNIPFHRLLPNLQELRIYSGPYYEESGILDIITALGETESLHRLSYTTVAHDSKFIKNFRVTSLENLHELMVWFTRGIKDIQTLDCFLKMVVKARNLRKLALPLIPVNAEIRSYLMTLNPELQYLCSILTDTSLVQSNPYLHQGIGNRIPMLLLNKLIVTTSFNNATAIRNTFFPNLTVLSICSLESEKAQYLTFLSKHIHREFPRLESLSLINGGPTDEQTTIGSTLSYTDLRPIFSMEHLQSFVLSWHTPLTGTDDDLKSLFAPRSHTSKKLQELTLSSSRDIHRSDTHIYPTFRILPFLAEYCSSLVILALQLDCRSFSRDIDTELAEIIRPSPFPSLKYLSLRNSIPIQSEIAAERFSEWLNRIVPSNCTVKNTFLRAGEDFEET